MLGSRVLDMFRMPLTLFPETQGSYSLRLFSPSFYLVLSAPIASSIMYTEHLKKRSPGATSWATGSKDTFMRGLKDEYARFYSTSSNHAALMGEFLTRATKKFFIRYGWELPYNEDAPDADSLRDPDDSMVHVYDDELRALPLAQAAEQNLIFIEHRRVR